MLFNENCENIICKGLYLYITKCKAFTEKIKLLFFNNF